MIHVGFGECGDDDDDVHLNYCTAWNLQDCIFSILWKELILLRYISKAWFSLSLK